MEFRSDSDALRKYRDLKLWLASGLNSDSLAHATDSIAKRIDDYEWAIKKHGLKTSTGLLGYLIDSKNLLSTSVGAGIGGYLTGETWAALAGGGLVLTAEIVAFAANRLIDLAAVKRGANSEIAVLYEIKKKLDQECA